MKKFFENKWVDHISKLLLTLILSAILFMTVDINMFVKYIYPAEKLRQQDQIINISTNQENCRASFEEKNSNTNKRVDGVVDEIKSIKPKIDFMYELMLRNEKLTSQK